MPSPARFLPHLAARVLDTPLAIAPQKLSAIIGAIGPRFGVAAMGPEDLGNFDHEEQEQPEGVAVIPVVGSLVSRGLGGVEALSGLQGYRAIGAALDEALADDSVSGVLLDVDSFGGEVQGMLDLADRIRSARDVKPVWASVNENAYSAAYALASACERVYVTRAGGVGSIGVVCAHTDVSARDREEGVSYTLIHAGQHKVDGHSHAPLSESHQKRLQAEVNRLYALFVASVAADGRLTEEQARATEALTYHGEDAVTAGLADEVGTFDDALAALQERTQQGARHNSPFGRMRPFPTRS